MLNAQLITLLYRSTNLPEGLNLHIPSNMTECLGLSDFWATLYMLMQLEYCTEHLEEFPRSGIYHSSIQLAICRLWSKYACPFLLTRQLWRAQGNSPWQIWHGNERNWSVLQGDLPPHLTGAQNVVSLFKAAPCPIWQDEQYYLGMPVTGLAAVTLFPEKLRIN
jgi:hypothetical protein